MRASILAVYLCGACLGAGCTFSHRKPYANNPLLLYYKPTLSDSASILAERNARRDPIKPPMPVVAREKEPAPPLLLRKPSDEEIKPVRGEANDSCRSPNISAVPVPREP